MIYVNDVPLIIYCCFSDLFSKIFCCCVLHDKLYLYRFLT